MGDYLNNDGVKTLWEKIKNLLNDHLKLSGGTMKGDLILKDSLKIQDSLGVTKHVISVHNPGTTESPSTAGDEVVIGAGGNTFIGCGESPINLRNTLQAGLLNGEVYGNNGEVTYISGDSYVIIYTNVNNPEKRSAVSFSKNGSILPLIVGQESDLGLANRQWRYVYAQQYYVDMDGGTP